MDMIKSAKKITMEILLKRIFSKQFTLISELSDFDFMVSEWVPYAIPFNINTHIFYVCSNFRITQEYSWWQNFFSPKKIIFQEPVKIFAKFIFDKDFLYIYIYDKSIENSTSKIKRFFSRFLKQEINIVSDPKEIIIKNLHEAEKTLNDFEILN